MTQELKKIGFLQAEKFSRGELHWQILARINKKHFLFLTNNAIRYK